MLKVVSFDVDKTLTNYNYMDYVWNKAIPQLYAKNTGLCLKDAIAHVLKEYDKIGSDDIRWYLPEYWFKHFNLNENPIGVFKKHVDKIRFYPEVSTVLNNLRQKFDLVIASGIPRNIVEIMIRKFKCFKYIFSPISDLKEIKKTSKFYSMICIKLGINPSNIVHIGDDWQYDFLSPRKIGIKSFFLDRTEKKIGKNIIKNLRELEKYLEAI